ncbi:hypothetical protein [Nesterenkonia rhizosphaerae]|uniref:Uncharacterized protein n=1 Tax=Nesterenkonia rhizosphaerae TaxID=1348272 RepID=A0ABP9G180_9MICC
MSKTGGGRGTNQHRIKGTSQTKRASSTMGESSVELSAPEPEGPQKDGDDTLRRAAAMAKILSIIGDDDTQKNIGGEFVELSIQVKDNANRRRRQQTGGTCPDVATHSGT